MNIRRRYRSLREHAQRDGNEGLNAKRAMAKMRQKYGEGLAGISDNDVVETRCETVASVIESLALAACVVRFDCTVKLETDVDYPKEARITGDSMAIDRAMKLLPRLTTATETVAYSAAFTFIGGIEPSLLKELADEYATPTTTPDSEPSEDEVEEDAALASIMDKIGETVLDLVPLGATYSRKMKAEQPEVTPGVN